MASSIRGVALLTGAQALLLINNITVVALAGIAGYGLLGADKSLAALPVTAYIVGTACTTVPASLWMRRVGRRLGFITGTALGIFGALVGVLAVQEQSFWTLCLSSFFMGSYSAFGQYYRFAAAESVGSAFRSRAISLVLAGGIAGALIGPEASKFTKDLTAIPFTGTYAFLICVAVLAMTVQLFFPEPAVERADLHGESRPLAIIMRQPAFIMALVSAMFGYATMTFLMTATPIAMVIHAHSYGDAAFVIQWHVVAMFAPSFVTGSLIARFGVMPILRSGAALMLGCIAIALFGGMATTTLWAALVLLGIGWNFLYVGGTTLLTTTYRPEERAKTQAANDLCVFLITAAASAGSGLMLASVGWPSLVVYALPLPLVVLAVSLVLTRRPPRVAEA